MTKHWRNEPYNPETHHVAYSQGKFVLVPLPRKGIRTVTIKQEIQINDLLLKIIDLQKEVEAIKTKLKEGGSYE